MKKKIIVFFAGILIVSVFVINVKITSNGNQGIDISLTSLTKLALACGEPPNNDICATYSCYQGWCPSTSTYTCEPGGYMGRCSVLFLCP